MTDEMRTKELTNAFVVSSKGVLLGLKKRGFGAGKWNGFGGKIEAGEAPEVAAQREFKEEAMVEMVQPQLVGKVAYTYVGMDSKLLVYVFRASGIEPQEPAETEEMKPQWFDVDQVPFSEMWGDDEHWYPLMLAGKRFSARFDFDADMKTILSKNIVTLEDELEPLRWM